MAIVSGFTVFCDPLDLPDALVSAQEQGRLVIFAGAGVSMGPPANLPSFAQLAARIAEGTGKTSREPYDVFLGDLAHAGPAFGPTKRTSAKAGFASTSEVRTILRHCENVER